MPEVLILLLMIVVGVPILAVLFILYSCLVVSGQCSEEERKRRVDS